MILTRRALCVRALLPLLAASSSTVAAAAAPLRWRLAAEGWGSASAADIRAVLASVIGELWPFFPGRTLEPFIVQRGRNGPIVHYTRNALGEIVVVLDTRDTFWCQYAYQFSHEFCHILCAFDDDWKGNQWFEESLCECASLFVLRRLAFTWARTPPFEAWRSFAPRFREYADNAVAALPRIPDRELAAWRRSREGDLRNNPLDRDRNKVVALGLLRLFEADPRRWRTITWLNSTPSPENETFDQYLAKWHRASPQPFRAFIREVAALLGAASPTT